MSLLDLVGAGDFTSVIWRRGEDLWQAGSVGTLERNALNVSCEVQGSSEPQYRVNITLAPQLQYNCTCPYRFNCKHAAAVVMALQAEQAASPVKVPAPVVPAVPSAPAQGLRPVLAQPVTSNREHWLAQCQALEVGQPSAADAKEATHALYYLLEARDQQLWLSPALDLSDRGKGRTGFNSSSFTPTTRELVERDTFHNEGDRLDQKIYQLWQMQGALAGEQVIDNEISGLMLQLALESGRVYGGHSLVGDEAERPLLALGDSRALTIEWDKTDTHLSCQLAVKALPNAQIFPAERPWYWSASTTKKNPVPSLGLLKSVVNASQLALLQAMPALPLAEITDTDSAFFTRLPPQARPDMPELFEEHLTQAHFEIVLTTLNQLPVLQLKVHYGPFTFDVGWHRIDHLNNDSTHELEGQHYRVSCDLGAELAAMRALETLNLWPREDTRDTSDARIMVWAPESRNNEEHIRGWQGLLPKMAALCKQRDWRYSPDTHYQPLAERGAKLLTLIDDQENGWFGMALKLQIDGLVINSQVLLQRWFAEGFPQRLTLLQEGRWHIIDMQHFSHLTQTLSELYFKDNFGDRISLPPYRMPLLNDFDDLDTSRAPSFEKLEQQLQHFEGITPVAVPSQLNATLRDYQKEGLNWLNFLQQHQLGGILADDMGLGKTLQTLALLQKLRNENNLINGCLIVAPTSLLWNWQSEAERFTPELSVLILHGPEREEDMVDLPFYDIVITSYGVLQRDIDTFKAHCFDVIALDEAQAIKNPASKNARAARKLQGNLRLALTGTPLENHLGELWSIMDFALPNLLGTHQYFQKHYRKPIEQDQDYDANKRLAQQLAPFMLRRTKSEVVKELPPKTVIVQQVHLESDQRKLYEGIRSSMEQHVRELFQEKGAKRSHIQFLDALLKLRQACIDPSLVKLAQAKKVKQSAKRTWLQENLPEMVLEGRRILVFSQFVSMLTVIEGDLKKADIPFIKLTGASKNRGDLVKQFQAGEAPIFLISLKAGGAGLNLTAADTVIHVDPWWNPAVEDQATDRAYRIGQDKTVFVYKLVAQGTVEEKIQALQADKKALADALFDGTQKSKLPKSADELLELLG